MMTHMDLNNASVVICMLFYVVIIIDAMGLFTDDKSKHGRYIIMIQICWKHAKLFPRNYFSCDLFASLLAFKMLLLSLALVYNTLSRQTVKTKLISQE